MICTYKEQVTDKKWRVELQADTDEGSPASGADVSDLNDEIEFYAGSSLTILSPFTIRKLGESGMWYTIS